MRELRGRRVGVGGVQAIAQKHIIHFQGFSPSSKYELTPNMMEGIF